MNFKRKSRNKYDITDITSLSKNKERVFYNYFPKSELEFIVEKI